MYRLLRLLYHPPRGYGCIQAQASGTPSPYGDGEASVRLNEALLSISPRTAWRLLNDSVIRHPPRRAFVRRRAERLGCKTIMRYF